MSSRFGALPARARRRVVVTGVGAVTPLGNTAAATFEGLKAGRSAVRPLRDCPHFFPPLITADRQRTPQSVAEQCERILAALPCQVAAPVLSEAGTEDLFAPTTREPRSFRFALAAAAEALAMCGGSEALAAAYTSERVGVCIGMGMPGLQDVGEAFAALCGSPDQCAYKRISPFFVPKILANMAAGAAALRFGLRGPIGCSVTACATGIHNIGDAFRWVERGEADAAVCGATEACITPVGIAGFCRMNAMATKFNADPLHASRPFDRRRCGFVMGEGAGMLVLEELDAAIARGAPIICELRGVGLSSDAYHISSPHPEGLGAARCVTAALLDAGVGPADIGYANAHATSTPAGDEIELAALARVLRGGPAGGASDSVPPLPVSSCKGSIGHLLGAAGSVEAIATALALREGVILPNTNLEEAVEYDADKVSLPTAATAASFDAAVTTSFGFGGANAALVFAKV